MNGTCVRRFMETYFFLSRQLFSGVDEKKLLFPENE